METGLAKDSVPDILLVNGGHCGGIMVNDAIRLDFLNRNDRIGVTEKAGR